MNNGIDFLNTTIFHRVFNLRKVLLGILIILFLIGLLFDSSNSIYLGILGLVFFSMQIVVHEWYSEAKFYPDKNQILTRSNQSNVTTHFPKNKEIDCKLCSVCLKPIFPNDIYCEHCGTKYL